MDNRSPACLLVGALLVVGLAGCSPDSDSSTTTAPTMSSAGVGGPSAAGASAAAGGIAKPATAGAVAQPGPAAGTPGSIPNAPGSQGAGGRRGQGQTGSAGRPAQGGPGPGMGVAGAPDTLSPAGAGGNAAQPSGSAGAGAAGSGTTGADEFEAQRIACVDTINMYRATRSLPPLVRASRELEACSDMGAKKDGDANAAHSSAGDCRPLGAQNTCPGYPARNGDVTASLNGCLMQMWAEGEPPNGVEACIMDRSGCFQMHGHWINMQSATSKQVACGFYKMANGRYWMNQNFGR